MQTDNSSGYKAFTADNPILEGQRIKLTANGTNSNPSCDVAAAADAAVGVATSAAAAGQQVTVKLWSAPGTFLIMSSGTVVQGAQLYPTAAGKIDDAGTTAINLIALEAAAEAGDVIECARLEKGS